MENQWNPPKREFLFFGVGMRISLCIFRTDDHPPHSDGSDIPFYFIKLFYVWILLLGKSLIILIFIHFMVLVWVVHSRGQGHDLILDDLLMMHLLLVLLNLLNLHMYIIQPWFQPLYHWVSLWGTCQCGNQVCWGWRWWIRI